MALTDQTAMVAVHRVVQDVVIGPLLTVDEIVERGPGGGRLD